MQTNRRQFLATAAGLLALRLPAAAATTVSAADLAQRLKRGAHPLILQVGFEVLYQAAHIPEAEYAGPASKPEGLERLRRRLAGVARDREVVLYCGCCPWVRCPNIQPAGRAARALGFRRVELLYLRDSFAKNWVEAGYPAVGRDIRS